jgi:hypothetical protein
MEAEVCPLELADGVVELELAPFELKTVCFRLID